MHFFDVVSIGSLTRDSFWEIDVPIIPWKKARSGKALAIPFGEKFGASDMRLALGGNAANSSVTFARQGLSVALFSRIGRDAEGKEAIHALRREGVSTHLVEMSEKLRTAFSVLLLQGGERSIFTYHGSLNEFTLKYVNPEKLKSRWWYVSLPGDSYKEFPRILRFAKQAGVRVALNPSYKHLTGSGREQLLRHLKDIAFLVMNAGEASELTGVSFRDSARVFRALDRLVPGIVAVTDGPRGVTVSDGHALYKAGIFREKKIRDRTGAGDAFGSGFVAGLAIKNEECKKGYCRQENIEYAIRIASANATSVVEHIGATEGILTRKEFETQNRWSARNLPVRRTELSHP